ncbi:hypothetical protein DUI87_14430 [Hirundo rustica rustica]|uniref:Uncharacterized protein n=1 Tax=Hirundo rustica rustica TaxID=333673 RepID=A0A3M0KAW7_HIRRU|nr:hypothetical protein DUI87_14430 [Hirundo rustica rustica]
MVRLWASIPTLWDSAGQFVLDMAKGPGKAGSAEKKPSPGGLGHSSVCATKGCRYASAEAADGHSPFRPPGQLAKREQPGTGNDEESRSVSIPAAGKADVQVGVNEVGASSLDPRNVKKMGQCTSKKKKSQEENNKVKSIPPGSPLEQLLAKWDSVETTKRLDQVKMVVFCTEVWPKLKLPGEWPWFGTHDEWMCYQLNQYLRTQEDPKIASEYANKKSTGILGTTQEREALKAENQSGIQD